VTPLRRSRSRRREAPDPDRTPLDRAVDVAARHLSRRMRSRKELADHLARKGFDVDVIEAACDRLTELGHLDDRAYAGAFARDRVRLSPRGYARIGQELRQRGVDREVVGEVLRETEADFPELDLARRLLVRRRRSHGALDDPDARQSAMRWLAGRGFRHDTVRRALEEAASDDDGTCTDAPLGG